MSLRTDPHRHRGQFSGLLSRALLTCAIWMVSFSANAGDTAFRLTLEGSTLIVTSLGKDQAFYPAVLRLLSDGRWQPLLAKPGATLPAELITNADYRLVWPDTQPPQDFSRIENLLPVMVRYFDVNGASFGQIAFLNPPPPATDTLQAGYTDGSLAIFPPQTGQTIIASWVLWPQEEGIAPLDKPLRFEHVQPQAQRIAWQIHAGTQRINTGGAQPEVVLLHETDRGLMLQTVAGNTDHQQRTNWLDSSTLLYRAALIAALLAAIARLLQSVRTKRV